MGKKGPLPQRSRLASGGDRGTSSAGQRRRAAQGVCKGPDVPQRLPVTDVKAVVLRYHKERDAESRGCVAKPEQFRGAAHVGLRQKAF